MFSMLATILNCLWCMKKENKTTKFTSSLGTPSKMKLYAAGQDLLKTAFSGNVRGMGLGVAEIEIEERASDPIVVFAADKTSAGSFNYPLFRMFADPMNTAGLVIDPHMICGFKFEVIDTKENKSIILKCPKKCTNF
jgi:fructose 1,6-bisphosphate aldolase/phosphatase